MNHLPSLTPKQRTNFWNKVDCTHGPCWNWLGAMDPLKRYGLFQSFRRTFIAHNIAYFLHNHELPAGMRIMRTCCNNKCVNPKHLLAMTPADIAAHRIAHGQFGILKMSMEKIKRIRKERTEENLPYELIAKRHGLDLNIVKRIVHPWAYNQRNQVDASRISSDENV